MNELSIGLFRSAFQVTLLTLATAAVYFMVGRRRPRAAASVAFLGLTACMCLTILACCPLPAWWSWQALPLTPVTSENAPVESNTIGEHTVDANSNTPSPTIAADGTSITSLWKFIGHYDNIPHHSQGSAVLATIFLVVVVLGLAWLGMGIWSLHALLCRSRPILQPQLLDILQSLRCAMGVCQSVELRGVSDLATAATVGWRKPVLLLSNEWAMWTDAELRAVLAHELAHIRRADYAVWLLATASMVTHFYHPLTYWLASRLKLQQELAADALAALHAGGANTYRRSLARLALRQDRLPLPGPARAFLSNQGTFVRRIAMLREKDFARHTSTSWKGRLGLPALLGVVALAVSALRLPAQDTGKEQIPTAAPTAQVRTEFDRSFTPLDADGTLSFRPAEIVAQPAIKKLLAQNGVELNTGLATELSDTMGISGVKGLPRIEEIEQVSAGVYFQFHPEILKGPQHAMYLYGVTIRTIHDFDWKQLLSSLPKASIEFTPIERGGRSYFKATKFPVPMGAMTLCLLIPDSRTLVIDTEKNIQALIDSNYRHQIPWPEGWNRVSRSLIAITLNNENNRYGSRLKGDRSVTAEYAEVLKNLKQFVCGIDGQEEMALDLRAQCVSSEAAASMTESIRKGLRLADMLLTMPTSDADAEQKAANSRIRGLLKSIEVVQSSTEVRALSRVKMTLATLLTCF